MYKVIEEFPKWEINEEGHIRNVKTKRTKYVHEHSTGYLLVCFKKDGKVMTRKVHRLVALCHLEPPSEELRLLCESKWPYKPCVNHIDHNKLNNNVENLEWCDVAYNNKAAIKMGVVPALKGSLNGRAILTEDIVHSICKDYQEGFMPTDAIKKYGISRQQATKIRAGYAWKHIWSQYDIKVNRRK